jgi:hypothetical protein
VCRYFGNQWIVFFQAQGQPTAILADKGRGLHGKGCQCIAYVGFVKGCALQSGLAQAFEQSLQGWQIGHGKENEVIGLQMPTRRDLRVAHQELNNGMCRLDGLISRCQVTTGDYSESACKFLVWNLCLIHLDLFIPQATAILPKSYMKEKRISCSIKRTEGWNHFP